VPSTPLVIVSLFALGLVGLAVYFGRKQVVALRTPADAQEPIEDRRYARNRAWRLLVGCVLLVACAVLLVGWFAFGVDAAARRLLEEAEVAARTGEKINPEQRRALFACVTYVILGLTVFSALLVTAALDWWAIRAYARRHHRKIEEDRRAMIERQAARLRSQRNGHQ
jgi:hypothetical protein